MTQTVDLMEWHHEVPRSIRKHVIFGIALFAIVGVLPLSSLRSVGPHLRKCVYDLLSSAEWLQRGW